MNSKLPSRIGVLASACAVAFSVSGCNSASQAIQSGNDDGAASSIESISPSATTEQLASPFDEYRNLLWSADLDQESQLRQFEATQRRAEEFTARCMHALGFEYLPDLDSMQLIFPDAEMWRPDDIEWVAQWGYGWVVSPTITRGGRGPTFAAGMSDGGPNLQMLEELGEAEHAAWWDALWGPPPAGETYNCFSYGRNRAWNEADILNSEEFAPLMEAIGEMEQTISFQPSDADRLWAACMFDAGYPGFSRQPDAAELILTELTEIQTTHALDPNSAPGSPTVENSPAMAALRDQEITLALADLACRESTNFAAGHEAHRVAIETQFVHDHRAALSALRDAAEQRD